MYNLMQRQGDKGKNRWPFLISHIQIYKFVKFIYVYSSNFFMKIFILTDKTIVLESIYLYIKESCQSH